MPYHRHDSLKVPCNENSKFFTNHSSGCVTHHQWIQKESSIKLKVGFARENLTLGYRLIGSKGITDWRQEWLTFSTEQKPTDTARQGRGGRGYSIFTWKTVGLSSDSCPCRRLNLPSFSWMVASESPLAMGLGIPSSTWHKDSSAQ